MPRRLLPIVLLLPLIFVGLSVAAFRNIRSEPEPEPVAATEQEWIVHRVVRGIVDMSRVARRQDVSRPTEIRVTTVPAPPATLLNDASYELATSIPGLPRRLKIENHAWAAETYVPVARALFPRRQKSADPDGDTALVADLTNPTLDVLNDASVRISARLQRDPGSPSAHEDAALLLGSLALKEVAREQNDGPEPGRVRTRHGRRP